MEYEKTRTYSVTETIHVESCPFCGCDDLSVYSGQGREFDGYGCVACKSCDAKILIESHNIGYGDTVEGLLNEAIRRWNRRVR